MQTFLPYPDFEKSAKVLDYRRLGKQRCEAMQLLNILNGFSIKEGWKNHPATKMWRGHRGALKKYCQTMINEWISRGSDILPTLKGWGFHTMNELGKSANEISKIIDTISEISAKTNLLALNATIEAARAGDAGRGFAVVASEIKELSKQTENASNDIQRKIEGMQHSTNNAIEDRNKINVTIQNASDVITGIAAAIEEQSVATKSIAENIAQVATGVKETNVGISQTSSVAREISKDISDINTNASQSADGCVQVETSAKELSKEAETLKKLVSTFKV